MPLGVVFATRRAGKKKESFMSRRFVMALSFVVAGGLAGAAQARQAPSQQTPAQQSTSPQANQTVTVTGCVAGGPNNTFTLTSSAASAEQTPVTGTTATTPAGSKVAKTITYTLMGSPQTDLKSHVGHTVQVTGIEQAPQVTTKTDERGSGTAAPRGTSGSAAGAGTPKVETTAQAQIVLRQLTVNNVKMVKNTCELIK
jgi:hypothetical protein